MSTDAISPLLAAAGAVATTSAAEPGVAAHYGEPFREQRALAAGTALVDLSGRGVVTVTGPDRLSWLDSLTSQAVSRLAPGASAETLLLDPTGRIEHVIRLVDDGETAWLLLDRDETVGLATWLDRMRFMLRVEVADRTAEFATLAALGNGTALALALSLAGAPVVWSDPWSQVQPGGWQYALTAEHPGAAWELREVLVPRAGLDALAATAAETGVSLAGVDALEALRIAAWRPRHATEVDERSIPHELDLLRSSVHLAKGCYRGQETVAKVHNLGHPPRRLVLLQLDGSDSVLPAHGDVITALKGGESVEVGAITSSAWHYEDGPVALGVVKRSVPVDLELTVLAGDSRIAAAQEVVVPPGAGAEAGVPRLPRLGATTR
ncbi:folate-binding protein YgfZ [Rathayibacter rathayi]|uniref:CAF17-like 4Fe-4S cluster assembly/insertion protein YgfZ n=1 Tax=Rathayibacter rathayi TaxID=33887 RepID=UPI000CE733D2|nr:folate-binding protein YgfZ [Rathayibacter rathayi]PPG77240.1 folate-binding protein YgfZ [Rathayibacter rathayi]PPG88493.1 folate-binding protein YgfZ [Rathayibacter rathayi]PPG98814.1 folate-binding protein YgfZ [Rathayibacter rathayi]PPH24003.1 folate-binding protein YgfZ [Rathayibacter rathayi]